MKHEIDNPQDNVKEEEFRKYIKEKLKNKEFKLMCYASISFNKQKSALYKLFAGLHKLSPDVYKELGITKYVICGWAGDLTRMFSIVLPDFNKKFGKGISVGRLINITEEELK